MANATEASPDRFGVGGLRALPEVGLPIEGGAVKIAEVGEDEPPIADLGVVVRIQEEESLHDLQRLLPRLALEVDRLEVVEHPGQELPRRDRGEVLLPEFGRPAQDAGDQLLAAFGREDRAAVERIEEDPALSRLEADDEVRGEPDAVNGQPQAPADLDQDEGEGDRDAEAPVQDVVEKAVPRVVVLLRVPPEPLLLEQELAEAVKAAERVVLPDAGLQRQPVEPLQILWDVQVRILGLGDQERRPRQIELGVGAPNRGGELGE